MTDLCLFVLRIPEANPSSDSGRRLPFSKEWQPLFQAPEINSFYNNNWMVCFKVSGWAELIKPRFHQAVQLSSSRYGTHGNGTLKACISIDDRTISWWAG